MSTNSNDVVIIGAGFTGLASAYVLAKKGRKVVVVEADAAAGGLEKGEGSMSGVAA